MGSSLEYKYSVTQSLPGGYRLSGGLVSLFCEPSRGERTKVETLKWRLKSLLPCFRISPYFLFPQLSPLPVFNGLTVFRQRGAKIQSMPGSTLAADYLNGIMVAYLTNARLTTMTRRERLFELGGLESLINPCAQRKRAHLQRRDGATVVRICDVQIRHPDRTLGRVFLPYHLQDAG